MRILRLVVPAVLIVFIALVAPARAQVDPKTALLERDGFQLLEQGHARRAADTLRDALTGDPKNARLHLGAGTSWAGQRLQRAGTTIPLANLTTSFGRLSGDEAELAYAESAVLVRRVLDEAGGYAVDNLLRDLGEGTEFTAAFLRRIQRSFEEFAK